MVLCHSLERRYVHVYRYHFTVKTAVTFIIPEQFTCHACVIGQYALFTHTNGVVALEWVPCSCISKTSSIPQILLLTGICVIQFCLQDCKHILMNKIWLPCPIACMSIIISWLKLCGHLILLITWMIVYRLNWTPHTVLLPLQQQFSP